MTTARAIAREIGLDVSEDRIITGARWERLSIAERAEDDDTQRRT